MKQKMIILCAALLFMVGIWGCTPPQPTSKRWYTPQQVKSGQPLYARYCAGCHGEQGQGGKDWDRPKKDGSYSPQPLNGSGHSWHHTLSSLENTIAQGGTHPGATMPGFAHVTTQAQRYTIIAAFQDMWGDVIYTKWLYRAGL
ncbi:MAG: cytochrome c [Geopsychrobacter sp.]|nr:cytochrome c [Geopsychrobacter sp.]